MNNRVVIIDDHPAVRMALRLLLASEGYDVVAEAGDGAQALRLVELYCPSIMILDIRVPVMDGLAVIRQLAEKRCLTKIVVFAGAASAGMITRCRQLGAHGFVGKDKELSELVYAVRAVRANEEYFPNSLCSLRMDNMAREQVLFARLSAREFKVMQCLLKGMRNSEIAQSLSLDRKTVSTYKVRMFLKLEIKRTAELYAIAVRNGFF
ncbi:response regulator transcription factor [Pseudomonas sp. HS6]|uniref:response regulator transcription factor n=1 Tax=Pseudomonas sp. HS6 TaxID=2850559 RepID=UPI0020194979|nr:response regulator transcription factor [Pseudomonas sp. HS6]UQS17573.1 response regulator transcription factor [Pseudomonas sp. HS6]